MRTFRRCSLCRAKKELYHFIDPRTKMRQQACNDCAGHAILLPRDHPAFFEAAERCRPISQVRPVGMLTAPEQRPSMVIFI
jgi:hypothetical protein